MKEKTIELCSFAADVQARLVGRCNTSVNVFKDGSIVIIVNRDDVPPASYTFLSTFSDGDIDVMKMKLKSELGL